MTDALYWARVYVLNETTTESLVRYGNVVDRIVSEYAKEGQ